MATDINRVILLGRLTRDPELRQTGGGQSYCRISIAVNRNYTANGENKEEVSFLNCVAWGRQAEVINQYCNKGKQVAIDGRLQQRSWQDADGKNQSSVDVVIERLQMLGSAQGGGSGQRSQESRSGYEGGGRPVANSVPAAEPDYGDGGAIYEEDDVPF